jgi:hypothetical protein
MARIILQTGLVSLDCFNSEMPGMSRRMSVEDRTRGIRMQLYQFSQS